MNIENKEQKIGKRGGNPPQLTLSGSPCPANPAITVGVGGGHYVVIAITDRTDWKPTIAALKAEYAPALVNKSSAKKGS